MEDYYEDWKNEQVSFMGNLDKYEPEMMKGTRGSFGMDTSRRYYDYLQNVRLELIASGAIKEICITCKSVDTEYLNGYWTCGMCGETWNPLQFMYRGM